MEEQIQKIRTWLGQGSINIFGMPYAGKDTQASVLADLLGAESMGGGQILRNSIIPGRVREIMHAGELIPTEDYLQIVLPYLSHEQFAGKPLLLSAVGRWQGEETGVLAATTAANHPLKAVILLTVSEETARQRHAKQDSADRGHRVDDAPEVFTARLEEYRQKTIPVIDFYRQQNILIEVDGNLTPPSVTEQIITQLLALAQSSL